MPTYNTPEPISAVLDIPAGRIQLVATDRADTAVEVLPADASKSRDVKAAEQTTVEYADGVLRIAVVAKNQYFGPSGAVAVTVQLPAGSQAEVKAASADLRATGRFGDVVIESAQGPIDLEDVASARITTSASDVSVGRLNGPAEIRTSKGDIRIAEAVRGTVVLRTDVGEVEIVAAAGVSATLDAGTSTGRISNALKNSEGAGAELTIRATTSVGDIVARSL
ncbi:DUF4097 family beta strand repeat-containing protein [Kribbella sp. VKM Ac-2566]|uniref:DUF4097 family beta strand repeat-containing protein n=1 Tax=Kribbella sp. VKM Ac-2566 TaxID=2512218 RepID=UPI0010626623|nr:DUF4097 family beta strand repeat-containing protein [Kribbella sp. VKM Ac-2566]TDW91723.1 putative adhesin [Kribbella sp. VKM Ac-2566]